METVAEPHIKIQIVLEHKLYISFHLFVCLCHGCFFILLYIICLELLCSFCSFQ